MISRNGKVEKAASRLPWKSCQVPKETMERTKTIMRTTGSFFMPMIVHQGQGWMSS